MEFELDSRKILIIDDEREVGEAISRFLGDRGCLSVVSKTGKDGLRALEEWSPDCILLDVKLPDADGIDLLTMIKRQREIPVVMISGHGTIDLAVSAIKLGAYDFLEKPIHPERLLVAISNALELFYFRKEKRPELIGKSNPMLELLEFVKKVGPTESKVLITGENGTGKEVIARTIHEHSRRRDGPFVKLNCAAIPEHLVESELFGHERGAFTGAVAQKKGKLEVATSGTLLLDEVGDMSLQAQAKLLRVIESGELERVGGTKTVEFDVRLLSASNKNLTKEIEKGNFREDLYFRLNVVPIHVPPLRDRKDDIPLFVEHFLEEFARTNEKKRKSIEPGALDLLCSCLWPGNVRELKNFIERLMIMTDSDTITTGDVERLLPGKEADRRTPPLNSELASREKEVILNYLKSADWNVSLAASKLGIDRTSLHRKMRKYGVTKKHDK
ncbi:MAG: sigma-54 dependent transcriptional regulator [Candidatus Eisenbacteria bacterium]|nr:sigma-54 dependent transcriptional regulator [Candidatus Eisenbacteria bacterium]